MKIRVDRKMFIEISQIFKSNITYLTTEGERGEMRLKNGMVIFFDISMECDNDIEFISTQKDCDINPIISKPKEYIALKVEDKNFAYELTNALNNGYVIESKENGIYILIK